MRIVIPTRVTVLIDAREKNPLKFPENFVWYGGRYNKGTLIKVSTTKVRLPTGDYALGGFEGVVLAERKSGVNELQTNLCTKDWRRFQRCLERLSEETRHPLLFLDCRSSDFLHPTRYVDYPEQVLDRLFRVCTKYGLSVLWYPIGSGVRNAPHKAGEFLLRAMWNIVMETRMDLPEKTP